MGRTRCEIGSNFFRKFYLHKMEGLNLQKFQGAKKHSKFVEKKKTQKSENRQIPHYLNNISTMTRGPRTYLIFRQGL